jgi:hypothetical protein
MDPCDGFVGAGMEGWKGRREKSGRAPRGGAKRPSSSRGSFTAAGRNTTLARTQLFI